jgi:hypothetical protein
MMGTETVPETLDFNELTRLSAREDFINIVEHNENLLLVFKNSPGLVFWPLVPMGKLLARWKK